MAGVRALPAPAGRGARAPEPREAYPPAMLNDGAYRGLATSAAQDGLSLESLARYVGGRVVGDASAIVRGIAGVDDAEPGDIVFAENARYLALAAGARAAAIVTYADAEETATPQIRVANPRLAFTQVLELFTPRLNAPVGVHPTAVLGEDVSLADGVSIGAGVVLGDRVTLGAHTVVLAGAVVGDDAVVGRNCVIHANVTVQYGCRLGDRVVLHSGTVVGSDGFGYLPIGDRVHKVPQIGIVVIEDDVEIGCCTTVDRAKTGATVIGARTKIDNLVQIAHNCKIGPDCIIVAQVGIAGSTVLGRGVRMAGQSGARDHVTLGDGATVLGRGGVTNNVAAGEIVGGYPARPYRLRSRCDAAILKLPETQQRIRRLESELEAMCRRTAELEALVQGLSQGRTE